MRYIAQEKWWDTIYKQRVYGVFDTERGEWVVESYSKHRCGIAADDLNELAKEEYEREFVIE